METMKEPWSTSSDSDCDDSDELNRLVLAPPLMNRKRLSKQLSMRETSREAKWEKRRHQTQMQERKQSGFEERRFDSVDELDGFGSGRSLTDEDLDELKGCIDLGFGFNEEEGHRLCNTLPALDLYFAVTRQLSDSKLQQYPLSPVSTPTESLGGNSSEFGSPRSPHADAWKICHPGDNPQHVKTRIRHWAQAVACSIKQSS